MPFTLCHPALVIPLHRYARQVTSLPALVIGSMAPDFAYFFSLGVSGSFTHTPLGVPVYCVPAGLLVYLIYHTLLRQPVLAWLPRTIGARMAAPVPWPLDSVRAVAIVLVSLAIGAASHIFWDSFTHANTMIVTSDSVLRTLVSVGGYRIPLFKILQQLSSLVGFFVIATCVVAWIRRTEPAADHQGQLSTRGKVLALGAVLASGVIGGTAALFYRHAASIEHGLFNFVVTGMAGATIAIVVLCIGWQMNHRQLVTRGDQ